MRKIYLDNSSTSFPKAPGVGEAMSRFVTETGCNVGRGTYGPAYEAGAAIYDVRKTLARMFGLPEAKNVIFTPSVTYSLNFVIRGLLKAGDHVIISAMEHNSSARPCEMMKETGVEVSVCPVDPETGLLLFDALEELFRPNTRLMVLNHASNVTGTLQDAARAGRICRSRGVFFALDAAQSAGTVPIDMKEMNLSALCVTGHKGLLGPQGIGALLLTDEMAEALSPTIAGGTGSKSDLLSMPSFLPDRFEPGTLNLPGIYGLKAALEYLEMTGPGKIRRKEEELLDAFLREMSEIPAARVVGKAKPGDRIAVCSLDLAGFDNAEAAAVLEGEYGIMTRCGLHCAPLAHRAMGTFPEGTIRFSFGWFNTPEDVRDAAFALREITE